MFPAKHDAKATEAAADQGWSFLRSDFSISGYQKIK